MDITITQDSSPVGVGFRLEAGGVTVLERFIPFKWGEAGLAHVHREMLGLVFAVAVGRLQLVDKCVQIRVDSMSTVKYVRDRGGSSEIMSYLTKKLWTMLSSSCRAGSKHAM